MDDYSETRDDLAEELDSIEKEIRKLKRENKPVPLSKEEYRLELLTAVVPEEKKPQLYMQLFKLQEKKNRDQVGLSIHQVPKDVLRAIASFKEKKIIPYHPKME
jgi:hypothetical protein